MYMQHYLHEQRSFLEYFSLHNKKFAYQQETLTMKPLKTFFSCQVLGNYTHTFVFTKGAGAKSLLQGLLILKLYWSIDNFHNTILSQII